LETAKQCEWDGSDAAVLVRSTTPLTSSLYNDLPPAVRTAIAGDRFHLLPFVATLAVG
jgi:hypothetical protein